MTDRLSLANALADAKIERSAAERIATEIFEAIHDSVATKADLERLQSANAAQFSELKTDLERLEDGTKSDFAAAKVDLQRVEERFQAAIAAFRSEVVLIEHRLLTRLGGLVVVVAGSLFAALRYFPPAH